MIRTERDYQEALRRRDADRAFEAQQRAALSAQGLPPEDVEFAMQPHLSFHAQLAEEIAWYERVRARDFEPVHRLSEIGRMLIALRIASGFSQRDLAQRLGVDESQVSRDERHEYYNITIERAQRIADLLLPELNARLDVRIQERPEGQQVREPLLV